MSKFSLQQLLADRGLTPEERRDVLEDLFVFGKKNRNPYFVRMSILLVLSTMIATAGLLSDSAAVVIGAMLVAPLMSPVMAAAGAVVMGWPGRFYGSLWLVTAMGLAALLLSSLITVLSPDLVFIPEQVLARTRPTFYDLLIALAAGSAGAYTITRKETSAIPGVAVAVALLPPLASAGILLVSAEFELAMRAVILFLTNLIAMILAGALTFMAVGVSPATARKTTATFVRNQLSLFLALTIAVSVPLWFYSEKILFNARYRAAKSEILQDWLKASELELVDIEVLKERREVYLALEGPSPPVSLGELHQQLVESRSDWAEGNFTIHYSWTQKVTGIWPQAGTSIGDIAKNAESSQQQLESGAWIWQATQYNAESSASPSAEDHYTLRFKNGGKFEITAPCGSWKGKYSFGGRSLDIEMSKNWFSGCRKDSVLKIFLDDLGRARAAFVDGSGLQITLAGSEGIMYFKQE
jgi:uncharacterized hydrophobic protein (TIGR00271 family)